MKSHLSSRIAAASSNILFFMTMTSTIDAAKTIPAVRNIRLYDVVDGNDSAIPLIDT